MEPYGVTLFCSWLFPYIIDRMRNQKSNDMEWNPMALWRYEAFLNHFRLLWYCLKGKFFVSHLIFRQKKIKRQCHVCNCTKYQVTKNKVTIKVQTIAANKALLKLRL